MQIQRYGNLPMARRVIRPAGAVAGMASMGSYAYNNLTPQAVGRINKAAGSAYNRIGQFLANNKSKRSAQVQGRRLRGARAPLSTGVQLPSPGGESKSFFSYSRPLPTSYKGPSKFLGVNSVNRSSGFNAVATQGKQTAQNLGSYFNNTDITNIFTDVGETATAQNSGKALLVEARAKAFITNSETTNCHFTIYEVMARQDGGALNTDPSSTFLAGGADANGGASTDATIPGTSPFSNPRFLEAYKILKKTPVILSPGMTHCHQSIYQPNRIISQERTVISGVGAGPLGQLTIWTFIIYHGTPAHDNVTLTSVTLSKASLDIVLLEEIKFKQMIRDYAFNSITSTLSTLLTLEQVAQATDAEVLDTHT